MNKVKGNMYNFVSHTWNPIKGECSHNCSYCYMKVWKQKPIRLVEKELNDDLGESNFIFVGSSTDMFADDVPDEWIKRVLTHTIKYNDNQYLFQTRNLKRLRDFYLSAWITPGSIIATTIESNRLYSGTNAPSPEERKNWLKQFKCKTMVTIEPILDFDLDVMVKWIKDIGPFQVAIGADSKGHNLPESSKEKVKALIKELSKFTKVIQKNNLKRLK